MQKTTNYELNVIEQSDKILESVTALGENATMLDTILNDKVTASLVTAINSSSTDGEVPSAKCVYDAIQSGGGGVVPVVNDIRIWTTSDGIYELPTGCTIYYDGASGVVGTSTESPAFLFINTYDALTKYWWAVPFGSRIIYGSTTETSGNYQTFYFASDYEHTSNKTSAINSSSTIYTYPNTQAVYYYGQNIQSTLQTEVDTLKAQIPSTTATGETITITDSSNLALKDFQMLGNATQFTTTGKNLLASMEQGGINSSGEDVSNTKRIRASNYIEITNGQKYTISMTSSGTIKCIVYYFDTSKNFVEQTSSWQNMSYTFTAPYDGFVRFVIRTDPEANITPDNVSNAMLENSASATSYEPYTGGKASPNPSYPQNVNVVTGDNTIKVIGKNIFNLNGTYYRRNAQKNSITITNNSASVSNTDTSSNGLIWWNIPVEIGKTITISYGDLTETTTNLNNKVQYYFSDTPITSYISGWELSSVIKTDKSATFTATNSNLVVALRMGNGTSSYTIDNIQVEINSTSTTYEAYQEQSQLLSLGSIELAKIGDYQDRIYKSGDKWYVEKNIGKKILNGSEDWTKSSSTSYDKFIYGNSQYKQDENSLCNYFAYSQTDANGTWHNNQGVQLIFDFEVGTMTSLDAFQTWASENNIICWQPLKTPTTTEITDTTLLGQLEELMQKTTYKNTTNVYSIVTGSNATGTLEVGYYQDIQTLINNALNA